LGKEDFTKNTTSKAKQENQSENIFMGNCARVRQGTEKVEN